MALGNLQMGRSVEETKEGITPDLAVRNDDRTRDMVGGAVTRRLLRLGDLSPPAEPHLFGSTDFR
jgi:hypothetical protein